MFLVGAVGCEGGPSDEELAEANEIADAALLSADDLPSSGWAVEDGFPEIPDEQFDALLEDLPSECRQGFSRLQNLSPRPTDGVLAIRFRQFNRPTPGVAAFVSILVVVAESEDLVAQVTLGNQQPPAEDDCTRALANQVGDFSSEIRPGALSLADARSERRVGTLTTEDDTEVVSDTEWVEFSRGRVFARLSISSSLAPGEFQALLEEFERRVVAAQD